ncbi:hypothetical protein Glove_14g57 [Diversispora epigaea]|uniref:Chalcone isomerase domain-containing protein n=1 Tax=Diversispora epigaea TaxID=1348612 RepID=A0A397JYD9_9GLOM|nr:hypothetical protein Glove_14g57 [Diversispora epigaea]
MFITQRIPRIIFKIPRINPNIIIPKQSSSFFSLFHNYHKSYKNHKGDLKDFGKFNSNNNSNSTKLLFILVGSTTAVTAAEIYKNKNKFILLEESSNYSPSPNYENYEETTEEPESKIKIPNYITLYNETRARLVGLGIRTVSFLKLRVYIIGMYISKDDIELLRNWNGWNKEKFLSADNDNNDNNSLAYELLSQPVVIALRIEPVRNTNGQHLRDGFTRTLTNRLQNEHHLNESEIEQILEAIKEFKSKFPKTSIKAGTSMILTKQKDGNLRMEYEGKLYGMIENSWISKNLFMGYLTSNNPISKEAKNSIAEGFDKILK